MTSSARGRLELDAAAMRTLLAELDERLRERGVAASVYVVGGAAMALAYGRDGVTPDIDALTSHRAVAEEARAMADDHGLTAREREVLALLIEGHTNKRIAEELFISESTAGVHVSNILGKLGVATRTEAATVAARLGLVE